MFTATREPGPAERPAPLARPVDALLEATVAGSFSRLGYLARRSIERWGEPPRMDGRVAVVTGASSGIGRAAALALAGLGAEVVVLGRDADRTHAVADGIRASGASASAAVVDVAEGASITAFVEQLRARHGRLDALVHCAGALLRSYQVNGDGIELTVATHVLGPYRLTYGLAPLLKRAGSATVVIVSSGGMYTERFDLEHLEMPRDRYDGVKAYARAKRAQVVLAHAWSRRWSSEGVASYSMHPGWVDTPGLTSGLPSFRLGPLLRRPEEGADTAVWLAAGGARSQAGGPGERSAGAENGFWHDRRRRSELRLPWTRPAKPLEDQGRRLWEWCARRTGLGVEV
ncbi:MAG TPA: SDR family NAD(P)-dependent oxidoreductase [Acidimicrobiales bacterium]|nr:SDR family NAD(P)-dependent oxidoreductase [Acidimicrobiales bacterium]